MLTQSSKQIPMLAPQFSRNAFCIALILHQANHFANITTIWFSELLHCGKEKRKSFRKRYQAPNFLFHKTDILWRVYQVLRTQSLVQPILLNILNNWISGNNGAPGRWGSRKRTQSTEQIQGRYRKAMRFSCINSKRCGTKNGLFKIFGTPVFNYW